MQKSQWLDEAELFEIADSLLFEERLKERLEFLYKEHTPVNGPAMFDKIMERLQQIKNEFDRQLMESTKRIVQERSTGNTFSPKLKKLNELHEEIYYPTFSIFPKYSHKKSHLTWQEVDAAQDIVKKFVGFKKTEAELKTLREEITDQFITLEKKLSELPQKAKSQNNKPEKGRPANQKRERDIKLVALFEEIIKEGRSNSNNHASELAAATYNANLQGKEKKEISSKTVLRAVQKYGQK